MVTSGGTYTRRYRAPGWCRTRAGLVAPLEHPGPGGPVVRKSLCAPAVFGESQGAHLMGAAKGRVGCHS